MTEDDSQAQPIPDGRSRHACPTKCRRSQPNRHDDNLPDSHPAEGAGAAERRRGAVILSQYCRVENIYARSMRCISRI